MFAYQAHVVGGREAHKIVGVDFLFYPPNCVIPPLFHSPILWGDGPMFGSTTRWGVHQKWNIDGCSSNK